MITYRTSKEHLFHADIGTYISYGITAISIENNHETVITHVSDVFLDYRQASDFVKLCNENELDPVHLLEVIEDFIC